MAAGILGAILGLLYWLRWFGPTEAEVVTWGQVSVSLGIVLIGLARWPRRTTRRLRGAAVSLLCVIVLAHFPPSLLWPIFHGRGISDGSPPSHFVAHWAFALPHWTTMFLANVALQRLLRQGE